MVLPLRTVAALVAAGALLGLPAAAPAAPVLLAQIDEAATAQLPPLSDDPQIDEAPDAPEAPDAEEPAGPDDADDGAAVKPALPDTGAEAWLIALLGTGMVLSGGGLRLTLADGRDRRR